MGIAAAALAVAMSGAPAAAQEGAPAGDELAPIAGALASPDARARAAAFEALASLGHDDLPAIRARVATFDRPRFETEEAERALAKFRHSVGSRRADDPVDIAPGVLPRLAEDRSTLTVALAERVALIRALERIATAESGLLIADIFATDFQLWRWEAKRVAERGGVRLLPAMLRAQSHRSPRVRTWARSVVAALGATQPGRAVQQDDPTIVAGVLRVYAEMRDMSAMPVIASFVDSERMIVRDAARWAMERYGQNGIWQLRRVFKNRLGRDADTSWGWERTMRELYDALDEQRLAPVRADLEAGLTAAEAGDFRTMQARFDAVLARAPSLARRDRMAPGLARLGASRLAVDDLDGAIEAYRRALRLAPSAPEATAWRAQLAFAETERRLVAGLADVEGYRHVLELEPSHERARVAVDELTGEAARRDRERRRWIALGAAAAFAIAGLLSIRGRRRERRSVAPPAPEAAATEPASALDTLPG